MRRKSAITDAELNRVLRVARKSGVVAVDVKAGEWQATFRLVDSGNNQTVKVAKREPIRLG